MSTFSQGLGLSTAKLTGDTTIPSPCSFGRTVIAIADADVNPLTPAQYVNRRITLTSSTMTATRNIVLPAAAMIDGAEWVVTNKGNQAIVFKGVSGSGITIAASRSAVVSCDGTNVDRISADSVLT